MLKTLFTHNTCSGNRKPNRAGWMVSASLPRQNLSLANKPGLGWILLSDPSFVNGDDCLMSFKWDYTQVFITTPSTEQELGNISSYVLLPLWEFLFSPWRTEFKTIIPTRGKTVGVKSTSDSLGVSGRRRAQTPYLVRGIDLRAATRAPSA